MDSHFTITISDEKGIKQFDVHKIMQKAIWYGGGFIVFFALLSMGTIYYLNDSVDDLQDTQKVLQHNNKELSETIKLKQEELNKNIELTENQINEKREELAKVMNKLSEIEVIMGLVPDEANSLEERVELADVGVQQMHTLFQFIPSGSPMEFTRISSPFGYRMHPILKRREFHKGIDLRNNIKTPVYATADATVEFAGFHKSSGYGNLVILKHNYGFKTYFGHLNKVMIKSGQLIKKGQLIAYSGNTGMSSGPHLHYEVRYKTRAIDPKNFMDWNVSNYQSLFNKEKKIPWQSLIKATQHIQIRNPMVVMTPQLLQPDQKLKVR